MHILNCMSIVFIVIIYFIVYILDHVDHENLTRDILVCCIVYHSTTKKIATMCKNDIEAYYKVTYDIMATLYCYYYPSMQLFMFCIINIYVYSGMRLVFPIVIHTIETIKQHKTSIFYIHKSKKRKRQQLTIEHIRCKNNVGVYMYTTTLIILKCIK